MSTVLLLDGDIFAFEAATISEREIEWPNDVWTLHSDMSSALSHATNKIANLKNELNADEVVFCWSCPSSRYWRHDILPTYKQNRKSTRKPLAVGPLKEKLAEQYESFMRPNLEADDVMGILSTWSKFKPGAKKIIVSIDKDMQTIPGWLYNPDQDYQPWKVPQDHADRWHLAQAMGGDQVDGYAGCPGIGFNKAWEALTNLQKPVSYEHTFKSGERKGMTETRWTTDDAEDLWDVVVSHFRKAGLGEDEALVQAQVARIVRACDYNFKTKEVKPWIPNI